jgi:hypothetical protein
MSGLTFDERLTRYGKAREHFQAAERLANNPPPQTAANAPLVPLPSPNDAKALLAKLEWQVLAATTFRPRAESQPADPTECPLLELSLFESKQHQLRMCVELLWQAEDVVEMYKTVFKMIEAFQLDSTVIYSEACVRLALLNAVDRLDNLLRCIKSVILPGDPDAWDAIVGKCYRIFHAELKQPRLAQLYINQMERDHNKITALIAIGQLRDAFKSAIKSEDKVTEVRRVRAAAAETDRGSTLKKCDEWLQRHASS